MMPSDKEKNSWEQAGENLFNFALDRGDVKILMAHLSDQARCRPATVEYELQLLKIISTGWSISFFLENEPRRERVAENFWKHVHGFSAGLSQATGLMTGQDVDYFQVLQTRLDMYIAALAANPGTTEPAAVIGPEFARACGDAEDVFTIRTGARMFIITIARVKEYLESMEIQ